MTQDMQPDTAPVQDGPPAIPPAPPAMGDTTPTTPATATTSGMTKAKKDERTVQHDIEIIIAWVALLAMIVINALAQFGVLVHLAPGDSRASVFAWFTPDRYVQLIWIPIYALLAIWLIRIGNGRRKAKRLGRTPFTLLGLLFIVTACVEIGWVFAWHNQNYPSAISLVLIQTTLVWALWFFARRGKRDVRQPHQVQPRPQGQTRVHVGLPLGGGTLGIPQKTRTVALFGRDAFVSHIVFYIVYVVTQNRHFGKLFPNDMRIVVHRVALAAEENARGFV